MTFTNDELKILEDVPAGKKQELIQFAEFLRETHEKAISSGMNKRERPRLLGVLKGQVWISDDFNDPMDFVSEDEVRVLEAMRTQKKSQEEEKHTLQEAVV